MANQYISDSMVNMTKAYNDWGFGGVAEEIKVLDQRYAPLAKISRLSTPVMIEETTLLLAQLPRPMLESILDNTLVEKHKAQTIQLEDWNMIPRAVKEKKEPAIYVNYYTTPNGSGLTIPEYEEYIQAMEDVIQGKSTSVRGIDIVKEVNKYYKQRTNEKGAFLTENKGPLRSNLPDLITYQQRVIRAAKTQACSEIRFPGEVGWAINTDDRVKKHHQLKGSAVFFRLTMCVVSVLWPLKNFQLTSYCLFRVVSWNHAEIVSTQNLMHSSTSRASTDISTGRVSRISPCKQLRRIWWLQLHNRRYLRRFGSEGRCQAVDGCVHSVRRRLGLCKQSHRRRSRQIRGQGPGARGMFFQSMTMIAY